MERLRQELQRVAKHHVPPPLYLEIPLYVLPDRLDRASGVRGELLYDQMFVDAAKVVENQRHVVDILTLPVAEVVRGTEVVADYVIVIVHLALVSVLTIDETVGVVANAVNCRL